MNKEELVQFLKENLKIKLFEEKHYPREIQVRLYLGEEMISCTNSVFL